MYYQLILGCAALGGQPYAGGTVPASEARAIISRACALGVDRTQSDPAYGDVPLLGGPTIEKHGSAILSRGGGLCLYSADLPRKVSVNCPLIIDWHVLNQHNIRSRSYTMLRSVFARGLALRHPKVIQWSQNLGITPTALCLSAALRADGCYPWPSVIIGPRSVAELEELVEIAKAPAVIPTEALADLNTGEYADLRKIP